MPPLPRSRAAARRYRPWSAWLGFVFLAATPAAQADSRVSPETAQRLFDVAREFHAPSEFVFEGVTTTQGVLHLRWSRQGRACPDLTVADDPPTLEVPAGFEEACPRLLTPTLRAALQAPLVPQPKPAVEPPPQPPPIPTPVPIQPPPQRWRPFVAIALGLLLIAVLFRFRRTLVSIPRRATRSLVLGWKEMLIAGVATIAAFFLLNRSDADPQFMGADASIWIGMARDCLEHNVCLTTGAKASVNAATGMTWVYLVELFRLLSLTSLQERAVIVALSCVGVGTVCLVVARWVRLPVAVATGLSALLLLNQAPDLMRLWNPSIVFFPSALCFAGLLVFGWTGRTTALGLSAFFLALAINAHLSALPLVPSLLACALLAGRRPLSAFVASGAVLVLTSFCIAAGSTVNDLAAALPLLTGLPGLGLAAGLGAVPLLGRSWFQRARMDQRSLVVALLVLVPWGAGVVVFHWRSPDTVVPLDSRILAHTYLFPVMIPLALFVSQLAVRLAERLAFFPYAPAAMLAALSLFSSAGTPADDAPLLLDDDMRRLASGLEQRGWTMDRLSDRLQTPACAQTLSGVMTYQSAPPSPPAQVQEQRQVRLWILENSKLPQQLGPGMSLIPLRHGRTGLISEMVSWFDPHEMRYSQPVWSEAKPMRLWDFVPTTPAQPGTSLAVKNVPYPPFSRVAHADEWLHIPLRMTEEDRTITVFSPRWCPWTVRDVTGVEADWSPAATSVRIHGRAGSTGELVLECKAETCPGWTPYLPCVLEHLPDDPPELNTP